MTRFQQFIVRLLRLKPPVEPVPVQTHSMTMAQWRKEPKLIEHGMNLRQNRVYRSQLEVLRVEHPGHRIYNTASNSERTLGRIEGYQLCLDLLELFAIPVQTKEPEEATFEPAETE